MTARASRLLGQTVIVFAVDSIVGHAIARGAKAAGALLIVVGGRPGPLEEFADDVGVEAVQRLEQDDVQQVRVFLASLPTRVDHIVVPFVSAGRGQMAAFPTIARHAASGMVDGSLIIVADISLTDTAGLSLSVPRMAAAAHPARTNLIVLEAGDGSSAERAAAAAVGLMAEADAAGRTCDLRGSGD